MNRIARCFTRFAAVTALLVASQFLATPAHAAGPDDHARGVWLASSGSEPALATSCGRLALRDGRLSFDSADVEWQLAVSEIKRIAVSEQSDRLIVIEGADETHYVAILGPQMLVESPRRALTIIQKAMKAPAAPREQ